MILIGITEKVICCKN